MKRMLVVEEAEQARATAELVAGTDVSVAIATTGEHALDLLRAHRFDCLIVDCEFPDMGAEELLLRISASEGFSFPPIIVHASHDLTPEQKERLSRYSRSIIVKGARSATRLLDEMTQCLHRVENEKLLRQQTLQPLISAQPLLGQSILLMAEDIRSVLSIASALEKNGAQVQVARNGSAALKKIDDRQQINLVVVDIVMPGISATLHEIRRQLRFGAPPIIAMTHSSSDEHKLRLLVDFDGCVSKPVDMEKLASFVRDPRSDNR